MYTYNKKEKVIESQRKGERCGKYADAPRHIRIYLVSCISNHTCSEGVGDHEKKSLDPCLSTWCSNRKSMYVGCLSKVVTLEYCPYVVNRIAKLEI